LAHEEERWIEINIEAGETSPAEFLRTVVDPLVHAEFAEDYETWHFFWEPEGLRLRFRWRDVDSQAAVEQRLGETLDGWRMEGRLTKWWPGNHGREGERHQGEAEQYGPEVWDLILEDWEVSSEQALRFMLIGESGLTGTVTSTFRDHWARHVHLHTNRQFLSWESEIDLTMRQARGYLGNLVGNENNPTRKDWLERVQAHLDEALRIWYAGDDA
jgi:hypothetical protein